MAAPEALDLRTLDPVRQGAAERLALLLERAPAGEGVTLRASLRDDRSGWWWVGDDSVSVSIDSVAGNAAALHPERVDEVVAALATAEPLLDAVESVTGWVIEPGRAVRDVPQDSVVVSIAASRNGTAWITLSLAVPTALAAATQTEAVTNRWLRDVPLPAALSIAAAALAIDDAAALGPGDLLVLPAGPWRGTVTIAAQGDLAVALEPGSGTLVHAPAWNGRDGALDDDQPAADRMRELRVSVAVGLPDVAVTAADLAALREGGTLPLGPVTAGLAVTLSVGGRVIAAGEIVRLGDRFAVHVDRLASVPTESAD
ncbi:Flagellar motor switch/type III secretory pathway protein FliN [Sphingomonas guangdongensis]|uniref:Flagellar motor switch/type III secretory pathway protein FliN n=2 Tax=Sphingomonas guangdongensis TaxID=1141890 RepID=A0A285QWV7_9SPHN|nr:Flagellar motor switch/type III secretory pathway protein FliN [Sphingomonas guangdongensis]